MKIRDLSKCLGVSVAAAAICMLPMHAFADEKINSVSVKFEAEDFDMGMPVVDAEISSDKYSGFVSSAYEYYGGEEEYSGDTDTYIIELTAEDGWYFNVTKSSSIHLSGAGAEFVKASRQDNGQTLIITAKLNDLDEYVEEVSQAAFKEDGFGEWESAFGALTYRVALTDPKGKIKYATTGGTSYDFRPFMLKEGTYSFRVRPTSKSGDTKGWTDGGALTVTPEMAASNLAEFEVKKDVTFPNGEKTPGNQVITYLNVGWQKTDDGHYWYRNQDGSYPQNNWLNDGNAWYFFDGNGHMVVSNYVEWGDNSYYMDENGKMAVNVKTPDGRKANAEGILE